MPRVKLDYVVSFSSEDSENQADNLLANEVSKKKWLCNAGEPSCSVVLQLAKAVQISTVHIGACHAALVEVLVGRSEKPNDQFEVLVPSSVFLSPIESRRDSGTERVRSFSGEQLGAARARRWDRVRVVCSQPYNKHCKYGLSFIHIFEPEDKPDSEPKLTPAPVAAAVPARMLALDNFSSDEDEFKPGELFAKHLNRTSEPGTSGNTGAQIRQATSQALKNISDSSTKLVKTPITKASTNAASQSNDFNTNKQNRQKDSLMYTDDDELPHTKIDKIVQRHKDDKEEESKKTQQKQQENKKKEPHRKDKLENSSRTFKDFIDDKDEKRKELNNSRRKDNESTASRKKTDDSNQHSDRDSKRHGGSQDRDRESKKKDNDSRNKDRDSRKRPHSDGKEKEKELRAGPVSATPHTLLGGVVFALSGYENPRRARLRDAAVAMGATFRRDWDPSCTHLICAFPNTPKLKTVRASARNDACVAVLGEWVEQCCGQRRLLPWQWFATEPNKKVAPPESYDDDKAASDCDTDDEIEKVLRKQKKQRTDKSPTAPTNRDKSPKPHTSKERSPKPHTSRDGSPKPHTSRDRSPKPHSSRERSPKPHSSREKSPKPHTSRDKSPKTKKKSLDYSNTSADSDVVFIKDERIQANISLDSDGDETDEEKPTPRERVDKKSALPDFFESYTFVIDEGVEEAGFDKELLSRYVRAYGGVVMDASLLDSDSEISFVLTTDPCCQIRGKRVRADWVWRCHEDKQLCDVAEYAL